MNSGSNSRTSPWREWLAALLWLALIAIESTPWFSLQNTGHALYQLLTALMGPVNLSSVDSVNKALREAGHVTGYGVLSWLFFRALRKSFRSSRAVGWAFAWSAAAFFMTAAAAGLDEFHQTFLASRTGSIHDVFLDSGAALAAQVLLFVFLGRRRTELVKEKVRKGLA